VWKVIFIKPKIKSNKGFTLLELLISLIIMSIMSISLLGLYTTMTTDFFEGSEKMKGLHEKTRIMNLIKKDITYGTQTEVLNSGSDLKFTQPNETEIVYTFASDKLTRDESGIVVEILSGLSGTGFQAIKDGSHVTVTSATVGELGNDITLGVTGDYFTRSVATLSGGTIGTKASGTITYAAGIGEVVVDGNTFTYNASDAVGNNFTTIDDLVADIDALASVNAIREVKYIEVQGTLTGKTSKSTIDFSYIFEILDKKWEYSYIYPEV